MVLWQVVQKGASIEQQFIAEKVFDLLQTGWRSFEAQEGK
jgi:hypothetical protein